MSQPTMRNNHNNSKNNSNNNNNNSKNSYGSHMTQRHGRYNNSSHNNNNNEVTRMTTRSSTAAAAASSRNTTTTSTATIANSSSSSKNNNSNGRGTNHQSYNNSNSRATKNGDTTTTTTTTTTINSGTTNNCTNNTGSSSSSSNTTARSSTPSATINNIITPTTTNTIPTATATATVNTSTTTATATATTYTPNNNPPLPTTNKTTINILAQQYIPQHLLRINELHVSAHFYSSSSSSSSSSTMMMNGLTTASIQQQQQQHDGSPKGFLVPFHPMCYCNTEKSNSPTTNYFSSSDDDMYSSTDDNDEGHHHQQQQERRLRRNNKSISTSRTTTAATAAAATTRVFTGTAPLHTFPMVRENHHIDNNSHLYYAIQQRMKSKNGSSNNTIDSTTISDGNNDTKKNGITISDVDTITNIHDYVQLWEKLLHMERNDVLLKYEQFSQYSKNVQFVTPSSSTTTTATIAPPPPNNSMRNHHHHHHSTTASSRQPTSMTPPSPPPTITGMIEIKGIADASPNLKIGDIVLLRPMYPIALPYNNHHHQHQPLMNYHWTAPQHIVEIHGVVLDIQRGNNNVSNNGKNDKNQSDMVRISWINAHDSAMILYSMKQMKYQSHKVPLPISPSSSYVVVDEETFNVRFVPSNTTFERCLTALDWFYDFYPDSNDTDTDDDEPKSITTTKQATILHDAIIELLYPTMAPSDIDMGPSTTTMVSSILTSPNFVHATELNNIQLNFVRMVLTRTQQPSIQDAIIRGPLVLTGPAGTGKTKTLLCAVHAVLAMNNNINITLPAMQNWDSTNGHNYNNNAHKNMKKNRVLICTPSHTAADVVTRRLGKFLSRKQLFRLYGQDRPLATVPVNVLGYCYQSDDGTFIIPDVPILMQFEVIVCTCTDAHILYRIGLTNQQLRIRRQCYQTYLRTCCEGTNLDVQINGVSEPHFTHLFIDEAAQATEPELLIPLSVVVDPDGVHRKVEIALVGDPRQLSPSVYSTQAAQAGLDRSWMERLLLRPVSCLGGGREDMMGPNFVDIEDWLHYSLLSDGQEQLSFFLTLNYRGHPSFLMIPSSLFYADKLQSVQSSKKEESGDETYWCAKIRHIESLSDPVIISPSSTCNVLEEVKCKKQFDWPIHFRGVVGTDSTITVESGFASNSWQNVAEAEAIVEICTTLSREGVPTNKIGIMAPFRGQVVLIRKLLRQQKLGGINVGTIEDYQSVEFDVVLLSLVRSTVDFVDHDIAHRMGVFGQPKRSNVALTRAEYMFVVVGNPNVMITDIVWRQFLLFCHRNGLYYGEQLLDTSLISWTYNADECKIVRLLKQQPTKNNKNETETEKQMEKMHLSDDPKFLIVSSLERNLRK